ncbi:MAG: hypothetical protein OK474_08925 [Thaumarchaeota archaeon]|nr:hypothetical protein [Nitrososphaerota archaeon]
MGSILAGLKAGAAASLYFAASVSVFNALILLSFKSDVLAALETSSPQCSTTIPAGQVGSAQYCFSELLFPGIPLYDFVRTLIIAIFFAISIGIYFDYIPGRSYVRRTLLVSFIMLLVMLFLGLYGLVADGLQEILMVSFELVAAALYAVIFAQLYRRFTREVEFQSQKTNLIKIKVDKRDLTGRKRTFSTNSTHEVEAVSEGKPFKEWLVSGGVSVKDPKDPKTRMKIVGDGLLKAT